MPCRVRTLLLPALIVGVVADVLHAADPPRLFVARQETVAAVRQQLAAGDPRWRPAVDRLRRDAEQALAVGPFSVTHKQRLPASGDKHDYFSLGPYWWPDPNRPDGLPYVRRDGEVNPTSRVDTDRVPLADMATAVETLAWAYHFTGDERYARRAALLLRVWFLDDATRMNPHLNHGQAVPGRTAGRAEGIIETTRLVDLVDSVGLLAPSPAWRDEDQQTLSAWFDAYLTWLLTNPIGRREGAAHNNHGVWYDAQVAALALFVGREADARRAVETSRGRIASHIEPDGRQPHELARTRSFTYSAFNLRAFFVVAALGEHVDIDLWKHQTADGRGLRRALDYLAPYADPQRAWPHRELEQNRSRLPTLLLQGAERFNEPRYAALALEHFGDDVATSLARLQWGR